MACRLSDVSATDITIGDRDSSPGEVKAEDRQA